MRDRPSFRPSADEPSRPGRAIGLSILVLATVMVAGCRQPLFPNNAARTQFDAHDRLNRELEPPYEFDEFGTRKPNLRGRLLRDP